MQSVHQKLNGTDSQRTPFSELLYRAIRYSGCFGVRSVGVVGDFLESETHCHIDIFKTGTHWLTLFISMDIHPDKQVLKFFWRRFFTNTFCHLRRFSRSTWKFIHFKNLTTVDKKSARMWIWKIAMLDWLEGH